MNSQSEFSMSQDVARPKALTLSAPKKSTLHTESLQNLTGTAIRRTPQIVKSAAFGVLFAAAIFLLVLGTVLSFSREEVPLERAYSILFFNAILIGFLLIYLILACFRLHSLVKISQISLGEMCAIIWSKRAQFLLIMSTKNFLT